MSNSDLNDDKSMSSGGKEGPEHKEHKTGADRQRGTSGQPAGQRQQSTGQAGSGGQQGGQNPNRTTQQGGGSRSGKSSDDMQSKDPGHKGKS